MPLIKLGVAWDRTFSGKDNFGGYFKDVLFKCAQSVGEFQEGRAATWRVSPQIRLWHRISRKGEPYLSGAFEDVCVLVFRNRFIKSGRSPNWIIWEDPEQTAYDYDGKRPTPKPRERPAYQTDEYARKEGFFRILEVESPYDFESVKAAWRRAALREHPDMGGTHEGFIHISQAYDEACAYFDRKR